MPGAEPPRTHREPIVSPLPLARNERTRSGSWRASWWPAGSNVTMKSGSACLRACAKPSRWVIQAPRPLDVGDTQLESEFVREPPGDVDAAVRGAGVDDEHVELHPVARQLVRGDGQLPEHGRDRTSVVGRDEHDRAVQGSGQIGGVRHQLSGARGRVGPGSAPVNSSSATVSTPATKVWRYPLARCTRRGAPPGRSHAMRGLPKLRRLEVDHVHVGSHPGCEHAPIAQSVQIGCLFRLTVDHVFEVELGPPGTVACPVRQHERRRPTVTDDSDVGAGVADADARRWMKVCLVRETQVAVAVVEERRRRPCRVLRPSSSWSITSSHHRGAGRVLASEPIESAGSGS